MFGTNDNQDLGSQTNPADNPGAAPLPPSPFMDTPADVPAPAPAASSSAPSAPTSAPVPAPAPAVDNGDALVSIKEQALNNLAPLVGHLDQTPEEKFKTTMMLIQASDNSSLVKEAYQAAQEITDEKARAQALLDVVNEINYFTQKDKS
jgi:hypothetical protein